MRLEPESSQREDVGPSDQMVYLMRGLPGCGKSTTARQLAGEFGLVCETDDFFYSQVGSDSKSYDYDAALLPAARSWNIDQFTAALQRRQSPVVVDRGNGLNAETQMYVLLADEHGYATQIREPASPWWQELRVLLRYREFVADELFDQWANALSVQSRHRHRVPAETIQRWMRAWQPDLTVEQIRNWAES